MDQGAPISYQVLDTGVPVLAAGGEQIGSVQDVVAVEEKDIFHGIVVRTDEGPRFVAAEQVDSIHEHEVKLKIDTGQARNLPTPEHESPAYSAHSAATHGSWQRWVERLTGGSGWRRS